MLSPESRRASSASPLGSKHAILAAHASHGGRLRRRPAAACGHLRLPLRSALSTAIFSARSRECCRPWCPSTARSPSPRKPERPLLRFVADAPHDLSTITLPSSKRTRENAAVLGALPQLVHRVLPQLVHRLRENSNDRCCVSSLTLLMATASGLRPCRHWPVGNEPPALARRRSGKPVLSR